MTMMVLLMVPLFAHIYSDWSLAWSSRASTLTLLTFTAVTSASHSLFNQQFLSSQSMLFSITQRLCSIRVVEYGRKEGADARLRHDE